METERLYIRRFVPEDWQDLYEFLSQESVCKYEPYEVFSKEAAKTEAIYRSSDYYWAVCLKDSKKLIGNIYLHTRKLGVWELAFAFNEYYQGKGYATEAAWALINDVFTDKGAHRVEATCNPQNTASWKLLERLGFSREGHIRQDTCFKCDEQGHRIWTDTYIYGLLVSSWFEINASRPSVTISQ